MLFVGQPSFANLQLNVSREVPAANVEVDEVDASGNVLTKLDSLFDDGTTAHNDIAAKDSAFNNSIPIGFDQPGTHYYAARAFSASGAMRESNIISIKAEPEPSPSVIQAAIGVASMLWVKMVNDIALIHGAAVLPIHDAVVSLTANPSAAIASSIVTTDHSIAWQSPDGIESLLDCNQVIYQGKRGGGAGAAVSSPSTLVTSRTSAPPHSALLISAAGVQFEPKDEAQSAGALFTAAGWNITMGTASTIDFANLSSYGAIMVTAHGDSIPGIGPVIDTGAIANDTASLLDLVNHRTILQNKSDLAITPNYILRYGGHMSGTIVYVGGCSSAADATLAQAFIHQGAAAFIGYSGSVNNAFAYTHGMDAVRTLLAGKHNRIADIPAIGKATDTTGAVFKVYGNSKATLP